MAKCHYSGVELPVDEMMKLHVPRARAKLHDLRRRLSKLEEVVERLSETETKVVEDHDTGEEREVEHFRLVTPEMADVLAAECGIDDLFEPFSQWLERVREHKQQKGG